LANIRTGIIKADTTTDGRISDVSANQLQSSINSSVQQINAVFSLLTNQGILAPGEKAKFQTWYKDGAAYNPEERFKGSYEDEADTTLDFTK